MCEGNLKRACSPRVSGHLANILSKCVLMGMQQSSKLLVVVGLERRMLANLCAGNGVQGVALSMRSGNEAMWEGHINRDGRESGLDRSVGLGHEAGGMDIGGCRDVGTYRDTLHILRLGGIWAEAKSIEERIHHGAKIQEHSTGQKDVVVGTDVVNHKESGGGRSVGRGACTGGSTKVCGDRRINLSKGMLRDAASGAEDCGCGLVGQVGLLGSALGHKANVSTPVKQCLTRGKGGILIAQVHGCELSGMVESSRAL